VLIMPASSGTNWWKAVFSPASFSEANLGLSGGSAENAYNVSFGYLRQNGTAAYSQFQRGTLRVNTAFQLGKVTVGENVTFSREYAYGGHDDGGGGNAGEDGILGKNILMRAGRAGLRHRRQFRFPGKANGLGNNSNPLKFAFARKDDRNIWDRALGARMPPSTWRDRSRSARGFRSTWLRDRSTASPHDVGELRGRDGELDQSEHEPQYGVDVDEHADLHQDRPATQPVSLAWAGSDLPEHQVHGGQHGRPPQRGSG
jgi:hypothetical protein